MRIACLQFAPQIGDVNNNLNRADAVLSRANPQDLDLLVLPELAFSGYNFKSLQQIGPYLEHTTSGITSLWARTTALKYECVVTVGYPEKVDMTDRWPASPEYYNSAITVNADGETIANYRKTFLYYRDETWALEGPDGFYDGVIPRLGNVAMGICMDLNPYKFEAPWTAWEFAYHILHKEANLVIISMAWLTRQNIGEYSRKSKEPDIDTLSYWVARLEPLIRAEGRGEVIVVLANRCGTEDEAIYAGTSCVLGIEDGEVKVYGILGRGERELLVVDTTNPPQFKLVAEPNSIVAEDTLQSRNAPAVLDTNKASFRDRGLDTTYSSEGQGLIPSIDAVLADVTAVSPVETLSPHPFFSPERPRSEERLGKARSSIPASETQGSSTSISSSVQSPIPILKDPTPPRAGTPRSGRSSRTRPVDHPIPPAPKQQPRELPQIMPVTEWNIEHTDQPPDSASSMRVNTPWEASPAIFRAEGIIKIMKTPSPPIASSSKHASPPFPPPPLPPVLPKPKGSGSSSQVSPPLVPIMTSSNAAPIMSSSMHASPSVAPLFVAPTDQPTSPKSRNTSRSRATQREPAPASQDLINEPAIVPIIAPVEEIVTGPSRHLAADLSTQPLTEGGLAPHDERSMSPRPRSTGW